MADICLDVPLAYIMLDRFIDRCYKEGFITDTIIKKMPTRYVSACMYCWCLYYVVGVFISVTEDVSVSCRKVTAVISKIIGLSVIKCWNWLINTSIINVDVIPALLHLCSYELKEICISASCRAIILIFCIMHLRNDKSLFNVLLKILPTTTTITTYIHLYIYKYYITFI